ncbi:MFS transporter [Desulfogranum japonicum]|uniref:MFS transporter n=1 Tax=Desulfogranum japonicum TaxID=231447 RepID=UPI000425B853|nr:MFS transporter [Desulfogranum japonicum]
MNTPEQRAMMRFLTVLTIASVVGLQTWMILFNNFAVEIAGLNGQQVGIIQSIREIPGFLALLAIYIMLLFKEHKIAAISIIALGCGTAATGLLPSYTGLICTTLLMSFGFHYYETMNQSLILQYFDRHVSPVVFGRLRSLAAAAAIITSGLVLCLDQFTEYKTVYLFLGGCVALAGFWALFRDPTDKRLPPQRKRMVLRRKYSLYYFLTFMAGARRQIFVAFSIFLLVKKFSFTVQEVTILFMFNNVVNYFLNPLIGRTILKYGERKVLSLEYAGLIIVFCAYGYSDSKLFVTCMYIIDHILFNFSMAIRTYFQKIGDPRDIAPSMAVGFTINHIAAVVIPALGGIIWMIDYRIPFLAGAVMSMFSLVAVQKIPDFTIRQPHE